MYKYVITIFSILATAVGSVQAADPSVTTSTNDPMVMKIYPDGTKVVVRWSEIGKAVDDGEKHGGSPRIIAYDPGKEGIVPIGQTPSAQPASKPVSSRLPTSSSVVAPESTKSIQAAPAPMSDTESYGPEEGLVLRSAVGASFQQPLSGRSGSGKTYNNFVFQPGIRFDLEPGYNVTDWFRAGLESSFIYNQLHSLSTIDYDTPDNRSVMLYDGGSEIGNGALYQVPVLANVTFTYPTDGPIRGYLGGGTGAAWDILQVSSGGGGPYTSYHWNFVWEVTAGFTYNVMPGLDLDLAYKLLSTPNPNFDGQGHYQASFNHSAELGLAWRF